jgi:hypothetical protein
MSLVALDTAVRHDVDPPWRDVDTLKVREIFHLHVIDAGKFSL